jgi:hypothetical protein
MLLTLSQLPHPTLNSLNYVNRANWAPLAYPAVRSLLSVPMAGCMVSFGGYNGRYHNSLHVYRPEGYVVVKVPGRAASSDAAAAAAAAAQRRQPSVNGAEGHLTYKYNNVALFSKSLACPRRTLEL